MKKKSPHRNIADNLRRRLLFFVVGLITFPGIRWINRLRIEGMGKLRHLPRQNILFVCNHHTYFADVITLLHIFSAATWRRKKRLGILPYYLLRPYVNVRFIAAATTMNKTWIARLFTLAGSISVKRSWVDKSDDALKGLDVHGVPEILESLEKHWVITFPQGTTTPFAPGRRGTATLIKQAKPIVIPVVFEGFRDAFDKTGLKLKKPGTQLRVRFKDPLTIDYNQSSEAIMDQIMDAIEQSDRFNPHIEFATPPSS
jgi:1-acyl-sn-glycerol-3-phosphate acyltransferase